MTTENFAQRLAKDAVDGLLKQAAKNTAEEVASNSDVKIDPETQKKLIEREIKMAADPDFELTELAKEKAAARIRRSLEGTPAASAQKAEPEKDKAAVNKEIGTTAKYLLDMGIPPAVVASYLTSSSTPAIPIALGGNQGGITIKDVFEIVDRLNANRSNPELAKILETLTAKVEALERKPAPPEPPAKKSFIFVKADGTIEEIAADRPLILEPKPATGEPIELVKEKNRHNEKMEEIKVDQEYKTGVVDALGNLAEDIGAGAASQVLGQKEGPKEKTGGVLETVQCSGCHATIYVTPETDKVTCAKCGVVSERPKKA
jgi:hypothetical protein